MQCRVFLICLTCFLATNQSIAAADAKALLHAARSLRCTFSADQVTKWTAGVRSFPEEKVDPHAPRNTVVFDDIDFGKGTARIIGNAGAGDVGVKVDGQGALWLFERTPIGYTVMTTVLPVHVAGTDDFVVIEARSSFLGENAVAEQSSGSCKVIG